MGDQVEVLDGGVRRGGDVAKALALGANGLGHSSVSEIFPADPVIAGGVTRRLSERRGGNASAAGARSAARPPLAGS